MADVFVSHIEENKDIAKSLADMIESAGFSTWYYERDTIPGSSYLIQVSQAIDSCKIFALLVSAKAIKTPGQVTKEVVRAHEAGKPFMIILVDISHAEFQAQQTEWSMAAGASTSITLSNHGIDDVVKAVIIGLNRLGIMSNTHSTEDTNNNIDNDRRPRLDLEYVQGLALNFDSWMKKVDHQGQSDFDHFLNWYVSGVNANIVEENYKVFASLSRILNLMGYQIMLNTSEDFFISTMQRRLRKIKDHRFSNTTTSEFRIVSISELHNLGWTTEQFIDDLIDMDYDNLSGASEKEVGQTATWKPIVENNPDGIFSVINQFNEIIAYWHFVPLNDETYYKEKTGTLDDGEIRIEDMNIIGPPGEYNNRTVRVFISSTFRDMQEDRDYLVKFVFPELRKRCRERQVEFVEVDLRWGITDKQAERGETLPRCLEIIDRCRPYFIGLLGERYGWVPKPHEIPDHLFKKQSWLEEHRTC